MLNQSFLQFQDQGKNRMFSVINSILGGQSAPPLQASPTGSNVAGQAVGGFMESKAFANMLSGKQKQEKQGDFEFNKVSSGANNAYSNPRSGYGYNTVYS
jgi:hypothetical protein